MKNKIVKDVCKLIRESAKNFVHEKNMQVQEKGISDYVTNIDLLVEDMLVKGLQKIDNLPCYTEEKHHTKESSSYWVVDPIDGTTNFIHKYPSYCIAIAKIENDVTTYGFVYDVVSKNLFIGIKGQGAYLTSIRSKQPKALQVSKTASLSKSILGIGCPYDKNKVESIFYIAAHMLKTCQDIKRKGPASLDMCYVAAGWLDGYFEYDLKEWDYKAGKLILEEAGGLVSDWSGNTKLTGVNNILATNGKVHEEIMREIGESLEPQSRYRAY